MLIFVVLYGGMMGEEYWYDKIEVWKNLCFFCYILLIILDSCVICRFIVLEN